MIHIEGKWLNMKVTMGDIVELIISIICLVLFALFYALIITFHKYLFLFGSIYAAFNTAYMWEYISKCKKA